MKRLQITMSLNAAEIEHLQRVAAIIRSHERDARVRAHFDTIILGLESSRSLATTNLDKAAISPHARLMTFQQAATILNCSKSTIRRRVADDKLVKVDRQITVASVATYLDRVPGSAPTSEASLRRDSRRQTGADPQGVAAEPGTES